MSELKLKLDRDKRLPDRTEGSLYINGKYFCRTIEDRDRGLADYQGEDFIKKNKVYAETAIPTGIYKVVWSYSPKFKKNMPLICNVKGFTGIRIHSGTGPQHSAGCILIPDKKKLQELYNMIEKSEHTTIEIV